MDIAQSLRDWDWPSAAAEPWRFDPVFATVDHLCPAGLARMGLCRDCTWLLDVPASEAPVVYQMRLCIQLLPTATNSCSQITYLLVIYITLSRQRRYRSVSSFHVDGRRPAVQNEHGDRRVSLGRIIRSTLHFPCRRGGKMGELSDQYAVRNDISWRWDEVVSLDAKPTRINRSISVETCERTYKPKPRGSRLDWVKGVACPALAAYQRGAAQNAPVRNFASIGTGSGIDALAAIEILGPEKAMMPQRQGSIVNVTSVHERCPIFGGASYCASKAGLSAVTKVLALELAEHGITVNSVAPGETATSMNGAGEGTDATTLQRPSIPVGRPARPSEVAHAIASLCDPESQYLTGESVVVDGGMMLMPAIPNQHDNEGPNLRKKAEQDLSDTSTENGRC